MIQKNVSKTVATLAIMAATVVVATFLDKAYSFGLVAIGGASLAVCALIAVVTFSLAHDKFYYAIASGAAFGLVSWVLAYIFPSPIFQNPLASLVPRLLIGITGYGAYKLAQIVGRGLMLLAKRLRLGIAIPVVLLSADVSGAVCFLALGNTQGWVYFLCLVAFVLGALLAVGLLLAVETAKAEDAERKLEHFALSLGALFTVVANTALVLPMMMLLSDQYATLADVYAVLTLMNFLPELLITTLVAPAVIKGVRRGLRLGFDGKPKKKNKNTEIAVATETPAPEEKED